MALQQRFFRLVRLLSLILFVFFVPLCNATCYGLDGNTMTSEFQPCSSVTGAITVCCATNRTNYFGGSSLQGPTADHCLPNGLCHNLEVDSPSVTHIQYWRNGCTTTPVDDEHCLNVCTKPEQVISGGFAIMTPCDGTPNSTTWCCSRNKTCCGTDSEVTLAATLGASLPLLSTTPSTIIISTSLSSTETSTSANVAITYPTTVSSPNDNQTSLSSGALAGIAVSATVAFIAVLALLILGRRWKKQKAALEESTKGGAGYDVTMAHNTLPSALSRSSHTQQDSVIPCSMEVQKSPVEMEGPENRVFELS